MSVTSSKSIEIELASVCLVIKAGGGRENSNLASRDLELLIPQSHGSRRGTVPLSALFFFNV